MAAAAGKDQSSPVLNCSTDIIDRCEYLLTCPACKLRLKEPMLLNCDHVFCRMCIPTSESVACPKCNMICPFKDVRPSIFTEEMINIFKEADSSLNDITGEIVSGNVSIAAENSFASMPDERKKVVLLGCALNPHESAPKLFAGLEFFLSSYLEPLNSARLEEVLVSAGGAIIKEEDLYLPTVALGDESLKKYIVINEEEPLSSGDIHKSIIERSEEVVKFYKKTGSPRFIGYTIITDAIAALDSSILDKEYGGDWDGLICKPSQGGAGPNCESELNHKLREDAIVRSKRDIKKPVWYGDFNFY